MVAAVLPIGEAVADKEESMTMEEHTEALDRLVAAKNWIGALQHIRLARLEAAEEAVLMGSVITALVAALETARKKDEQETLKYLRSILAWALRDQPALASLYREMALADGTPGIRKDFENFVKGVGDTVSGKTTVEAQLRQGVEDLKHRAEEAGIPLGSMARTLEDTFRAGMQGMQDFLGEINSRVSASAEKPEDHRPRAESADGENIKVNIENAADPLPKDIHPADKADKQAKG